MAPWISVGVLNPKISNLLLNTSRCDVKPKPFPFTRFVFFFFNQNRAGGVAVWTRSFAMCVKRKVRVAPPLSLCVFSWVWVLKPWHECPAWYLHHPCPPKAEKLPVTAPPRHSKPLPHSQKTCWQVPPPMPHGSKVGGKRQRSVSGGAGGGAQQLRTRNNNNNNNNSCGSRIVIPTFGSCRVQQQVSSRREDGTNKKRTRRRHSHRIASSAKRT